ncbi:hypothetical protein ACJRO7_002922 [Eucalyptus globulus]|uniref:Uncharacterized protein n=1 Tax=Eucalyptus globulus TaxID=34317 RepID=A0ABD3M193_EUCGL
MHVLPMASTAILWFLSNPEVADVGSRGDSIAARMEGLTIEGDIDTEIDGTQSGLLPFLDLGDANSSSSLTSTSRHPQDRIHHRDKSSGKSHH